MLCLGLTQSSWPGSPKSRTCDRVHMQFILINDPREEEWEAGKSETGKEGKPKQGKWRFSPAGSL